MHVLPRGHVMHTTAIVRAGDVKKSNRTASRPQIQATAVRAIKQNNHNNNSYTQKCYSTKQPPTLYATNAQLTWLGRS